jgi:hypothetical protein
MRTKKVVKAVCVPLAAVLASAPAIEAADNAHVEQKQHEEEPKLTYDSPYTTTSSVVLNFPLFDDFSLRSIPQVKVVPGKKKQ